MGVVASSLGVHLASHRLLGEVGHLNQALVEHLVLVRELGRERTELLVGGLGNVCALQSTRAYPRSTDQHAGIAGIAE